MALQGTLDTFALPDVLRLLASTSKSGCLHVEGSRGAGDVWFQTGGIVAAETATGLPTSDPVEVLSELLRNVDGSFSFEAGAVLEEAAGAAPADVEPLLVEAEQLVAEWAEIEQIVPSMDAWVTLVEELPKAKVSVDAASWRVIIAVGGGSTVRDIGTWMGLGELSASRGVCGLVKMGLADIGEAPEAAGVSPFEREPEQDVAPAWENTPPWADPQWVEDAGYLSFEPEKKPNPVYEEIADPEPLAEPAALAEPVAEDVEPVEAAYQPFEPLVFDEPQTLAEASETTPAPDDDPDDDVLGTHSAAERDSAFQEPLDEDEPAPVDRSRLLKFLGSVGK